MTHNTLTLSNYRTKITPTHTPIKTNPLDFGKRVFGVVKLAVLCSQLQTSQLQEVVPLQWVNTIDDVSYRLEQQTGDPRYGSHLKCTKSSRTGVLTS